MKYAVKLPPATDHQKSSQLDHKYFNKRVDEKKSTWVVYYVTLTNKVHVFLSVETYCNEFLRMTPEMTISKSVKGFLTTLILFKNKLRSPKIVLQIT